MSDRRGILGSPSFALPKSPLPRSCPPFSVNLCGSHIAIFAFGLHMDMPHMMRRWLFAACGLCGSSVQRACSAAVRRFEEIAVVQCDPRQGRDGDHGRRQPLPPPCIHFRIK